jgi:hypothetical protein
MGREAEDEVPLVKLNVGANDVKLTVQDTAVKFPNDVLNCGSGTVLFCSS